MNEDNQRITAFLNDERTAQAVYLALVTSFLKPKSETVQELAAERTAINLLQSAWRELAALKTHTSTTSSQVSGL